MDAQLGLSIGYVGAGRRSTTSSGATTPWLDLAVAAHRASFGIYIELRCNWFYYVRLGTLMPLPPDVRRDGRRLGRALPDARDRRVRVPARARVHVVPHLRHVRAVHDRAAAASTATTSAIVLFIAATVRSALLRPAARDRPVHACRRPCPTSRALYMVARNLRDFSRHYRELKPDRASSAAAVSSSVAGMDEELDIIVTGFEVDRSPGRGGPRAACSDSTRSARGASCASCPRSPSAAPISARRRALRRGAALDRRARRAARGRRRGERHAARRTHSSLPIPAPSVIARVARIDARRARDRARDRPFRAAEGLDELDASTDPETRPGQSARSRRRRSCRTTCDQMPNARAAALQRSRRLDAARPLASRERARTQLAAHTSTPSCRRPVHRASSRSRVRTHGRTLPGRPARPRPRPIRCRHATSAWRTPRPRRCGRAWARSSCVRQPTQNVVRRARRLARWRWLAAVAGARDARRARSPAPARLRGRRAARRPGAKQGFETGEHAEPTPGSQDPRTRAAGRRPRALASSSAASSAPARAACTQLRIRSTRGG